MPDPTPTQPAKPAAAKAVKLSPEAAFKGEIALMKPQFKAILPAHIPPEKFIRVLQTAAMLNPELVTADRRLLYGEIMKCAQDGLVPDGREATIIVFGKEPKYNPMVAGICKKARNSGEIKTIDAQVVYEKDFYDVWTDEKGSHFKHVKARGERGKVLLTFAYAITKDDGFYFEEIDEAQMAEIEKISKAKAGPWKGAFKDEMRRKSALRRLCKYRLPSSADLDMVIRREDDPQAFSDPTPAPEKKPPTTSTRLKEAIDVKPVDPKTTARPEPPPAEETPPPPEEPGPEVPI